MTERSFQSGLHRQVLETRDREQDFSKEGWMTKGKTLASMITIAVVLSLISQPAHANMGVPMLTLVWPVMAMALVPIIIIESIVLVMGFGMTAWHSAWVVTVANLVSTVIGIPVTWSCFRLVES